MCKYNFFFFRSNNLKLKELPEIWLNKMLSVLSGSIDESCDSLCATRRSAGLPFLILVKIVFLCAFFIKQFFVGCSSNRTHTESK